jgi:hypothetical protein
MDKELVQNFVQECREEMEWKERCRQNFIEFDNYFKFSGKVETKDNTFREYENLLTAYPILKPKIHNNMDKYQLKKNRIVW